MRWRLAAGLAALAIVLVSGWLLLLAGRPNATERHMPFHIGCTHHNHGPKWHAAHGRIAGGKSRDASRLSSPMDDEGEALSRD